MIGYGRRSWETARYGEVEWPKNGYMRIPHVRGRSDPRIKGFARRFQYGKLSSSRKRQIYKITLVILGRKKDKRVYFSSCSCMFSVLPELKTCACICEGLRLDGFLTGREEMVKMAHSWFLSHPPDPRQRPRSLRQAWQVFSSGQ